MIGQKVAEETKHEFCGMRRGDVKNKFSNRIKEDQPAKISYTYANGQLNKLDDLKLCQSTYNAILILFVSLREMKRRTLKMLILFFRGDC